MATDKTGRFEITEVKPGVIRLWLETEPGGQIASLDRPTEIKPAEAKDLGDLRLAAGSVPVPAGKYYQVK